MIFTPPLFHRVQLVLEESVVHSQVKPKTIEGIGEEIGSKISNLVVVQMEVRDPMLLLAEDQVVKTTTIGDKAKDTKQLE